jgi:nuclear GTP-binding protein
MVAKKRKSKRQTLQQKYKIIKRCKEHHKRQKNGKLPVNQFLQQKKTAAKNEIKRIPNAWPYKEELLKEIHSAKERMEEMKAFQKEKRKEEMVRSDCYLC